MARTAAYIDDAVGLDDLWENDGTGTAALPADAIALIAARLDACRRQVDQAVTTATSADLDATFWASRLDTLA